MRIKNRQRGMLSKQNTQTTKDDSNLNWLQNFSQPNLRGEFQAGDYKADQSECKAGRSFRGCHPQDRQRTRSKQGEQGESTIEGRGVRVVVVVVVVQDEGGASTQRGAQYLTPASMLLLLGKFSLQALDLQVQLSLQPTQLRDQAGLRPSSDGGGKGKITTLIHFTKTIWLQE